MYKKISNQRKDFHFKLANKICSEYALICIEDLNIKGMQKRWGRKISDYGFSEFIKILEYKAREIGSIVQKIDTIQVRKFAMFVVQKILKLKIWQFVSGFAQSAKPATIEIEMLL